MAEETKNDWECSVECLSKIGEDKESIKTPPKPLNTSKLLQTASNQLNLSPSDTMSICQQLYQTGYITYMRTESSQYSKIFLEYTSKYI
jgi:DNA topoisomerase-1